MDFTLDAYRGLLDALKCRENYSLRHDVDLRPNYAFRVAQVEAKMNVHATYYFRAMHFDSHADIIRAIAALGHRCGYHYECLTTCRGEVAEAYEDFCRNLERLRKIVPVSTACAHGSPRSPYDSQDIWKEHDIHALGIDYEPMLDTDFSTTLYLTDTGHRWDGYRVAVRDKVLGCQEKWEAEGLSFHHTDDIIRALSNPQHPIHNYNLLINTHPQRWMPFGMEWLKEAVLQNVKNIFKRIIVSTR